MRHILLVLDSVSIANTTACVAVTHRPWQPNRSKSEHITLPTYLLSIALYVSFWDEKTLSWALSLVPWELPVSHYPLPRLTQVHKQVLLNFHPKYFLKLTFSSYLYYYSLNSDSHHPQQENNLLPGLPVFNMVPHVCVLKTVSHVFYLKWKP